MLQPIKREKTTVFGADKKKPVPAPAPVASRLVRKPLSKENKAVLAPKKAGLKFEATAVPAPKKVTSKTPTLETRTLPPSQSLQNVSQSTNQTFRIESIYNKVKAPSMVDIYNTSFEPEDQSEITATNSTVIAQNTVIDDIRRQTCIIGSPKITKEGKYVSTMELDTYKEAITTNTTSMRRSISANNLVSPSSFSFDSNSLTVIAGGQNYGSYEIGMDASCFNTTKNNPISPQLFSTVRKQWPEKKKEQTPLNFRVIGQTNDTPKLADFLQVLSQSTETSNIPSNSPNNLATQLSYDCTPFQKQPVPNKNLYKTPHELYTTCYDDAEESFQAVSQMISEETLLKSVLVIQRQWRMKRFRRYLRLVKFNHSQELIQRINANKKRKDDEAHQKFLFHVVTMQRNYRMKKFRENLAILKKADHARRLASAALLVQRAYRMKAFRRAVVILKENEYRMRLLTSVCLVQRQWRMKILRRCVVELKEIKYLEALNKAVVMTQRAYRMKKFRRELNKLKVEEYNQKLNQAVIMVQRVRRKKIFRIKLAELKLQRANEVEEARRALVAHQNHSTTLIQHQWAMYKFRKSMKVYRQAAITIQKWIRFDMSDRLNHLRMKRSAVVIQRCYRDHYELRVSQAIVIQKNWRMLREMVKYSYQMHQIIKIQRWIRSKSDRIKFISLKRSVYGIQKLARSYLERRNKSAVVIQKQWRMFIFRKRMQKFRTAACTIQKWHRDMYLRYEFLKKRNIICQIQALYRRVYMVRRDSAAVKIQGFWRICIAKRLLVRKRLSWKANEDKRKEEKFIHDQATKIQSWWRGYSIRKETNNILGGIRSRLSIYVQSKGTLEFTLGARIRNSLAILSIQNITIQQIIYALTDLEKVTRLSPECCSLFTREGAPDILYTFMQNCNRSVPHMDLIKICLHIFTNLAKYKETVCQVLEPEFSLVVLSNLIQSYQSSNPAIFMDVCILFILLSQSPLLSAHLTNQESFVKKLLSLHALLERRAIFKLKNASSSMGISGPTTSCSLNCSVISQASTTSSVMTIPKKGVVSASFTFSPEWSLIKKVIINLPDQLSALEYLLNTLGIKFEKEISSQSVRTPVKSKANNLFRDALSSSKSSASISKSALKPVRPPLQKSQSTNFPPNKQEKPKEFKSKLDEIEHNFDDHIDENFPEGISSFIDEPKMNSTVMTKSADVRNSTKKTVSSAAKAKVGRKLI